MGGTRTGPPALGLCEYCPSSPHCTSHSSPPSIPFIHTSVHALKTGHHQTNDWVESINTVKSRHSPILSVLLNWHSNVTKGRIANPPQALATAVNTVLNPPVRYLNVDAYSTEPYPEVDRKSVV